MKTLNEFPVTVQIPIAWGDMDSFGHVNNIVFFKYFETARIKYFEEIGLVESMKKDRIGPILAQTSAKFIKPLFYPDMVTVGTRITSINDNRFKMEYLIESSSVGTVAVGEANIAILNYTTQQKTHLPSNILENIHAIEPSL